MPLVAGLRFHALALLAALLPCPLEAGWQRIGLTALPPRDAQGRLQGGFSAAAYDPASDELLLLSDALHGSVGLWSGLGSSLGSSRGLRLHPLGSLPLMPEMDGEGMVVLGDALWVAGEGRRVHPQASGWSAGRAAELLRFERSTGRLQQRVPLPVDWQPAPGRGLASNQGPESLTRWPQPQGRSLGQLQQLLMAAESPLVQDPPDRVRLLRWTLFPTPEGEPLVEPFEPLAPPHGSAGWGLTELLVLPGQSGLLALWRRYRPPVGWDGVLALYPLPRPLPAGAQSPPLPHPPLAPLARWPLPLPEDNWEAMAIGPVLPDGSPTLVLASDDNFNPLQRSWVAVLVPRRLPHCPIAAPLP